MAIFLYIILFFLIVVINVILSKKLNPPIRKPIHMLSFIMSSVLMFKIFYGTRVMVLAVAIASIPFVYLNMKK